MLAAERAHAIKFLTADVPNGDSFSEPEYCKRWAQAFLVKDSMFKAIGDGVTCFDPTDVRRIAIDLTAPPSVPC